MILSATLTKHTKKAYIAELAKNSSTIEELNEDFRHVANDIDIHSFYELRHTALKGNQSVWGNACMFLTFLDLILF